MWLQLLLFPSVHQPQPCGGLKEREVIEATSSGKMFSSPNLGKNTVLPHKKPYDTNFQHYKCISSLPLTLHPTVMHVAYMPTSVSYGRTSQLSLPLFPVS